MLERYRPKFLEDFLGNDGAKRSAEAYFNGTIQADALMFVGQPGLGKTTLAHCFARSKGYDALEVNGSSERRKSDSEGISRAMSVHAMSRTGPPKPRLLIIDECESAKRAYLHQLLDKVQKKILICNEPTKVDWTVRQRCHIVEIKRPARKHYKQLLERMGIDVPDEIAKQFNSFRDAINWTQGGEPSGPIYMTEIREANAIFHGEKLHHRQRLNIPTRKLLDYFLYNGGDPSLASYVDLLLHDGKEKLARDILLLQRFAKTIKKPPYIATGSKLKQEEKTITLTLLGFEDA